MSTLDDIVADVSSKITTQTTGDNTALRVRTALINLATQILDDVAAQDVTITAGIASATAAANAAKTTAQALARGVEPIGQNLITTRSGQYPGEPGLDWQMETFDNIPLGAEGYVLDSNFGVGATATSGTESGSVITNFMPVTPGGTVTVAPGVNAIAFYDANKAHLDPPGIRTGLGTPYGSIPWQSGGGTVVSVPATALFCRAQIASGRGNNRATHRAQILEGTQTLRHPYFGLPSYVSQHRPWTNKVWSFNGDSIPEPSISGPWAVEAAKYHGIRYGKWETHTGNLASQLGTISNGTTALPSNFFDDVDCAFAFAGSNDATAGTTIGAITDATTASTFYGYYKKFIELIISRKQNIRIIMATIIQRNGLSESTRANYNVAIRAIAAYYGVHLWDIGTYGSQFSPVTFSLYSDDGIHPAWRTWNFIDAEHPTLLKYLGGHLMLGSNLKGLMHTIFPVDFVGDPIMTERDDEITDFVRRVPY